MDGVCSVHDGLCGCVIGMEGSTNQSTCSLPSLCPTINITHGLAAERDGLLGEEGGDHHLEGLQLLALPEPVGDEMSMVG